MTNENNNINELVSDRSELPAELEAVTWQESPSRTYQDAGTESEARTFDITNFVDLDAQRSVAISELKSDLRSRSETIGRLQFDIEQMRSKWLGLEMEIKAREEITADLNTELESLRSALRQKDKLLQEQDRAGQLASRDRLIAELREQLHRKTHLLQAAEEQKMANHELSDRLKESSDAHADELRMLRFELGEAQESITQHELVAEQLALDLVDSHGFKNELERMFDVSETHYHTQIDDFEKRVAALQHTLAEYEQKSTAKSDAINRLQAELAARGQQIGSIGQIEDVINNTDDRIAERFDGPSTSDRDRISRVLIGSINNQELRFPLFKDRLTIGRTRQNDIQLKADYVSRRHAVIVTEGKTTRIIDWGSRNGVYVNSHRIAEHFLRRGDIVTIGTADFRYEERPKRDV